MPRPSKKAERRQEILAAVGRCIAKFGVAGTTLDHIAEESELSRQLLRHNIGNREAILAAFYDAYFAQQQQGMVGFRALLAEAATPLDCAELLLGGDLEDRESILVAQALNIAAAGDRALAQRLHAWTAENTAVISTELQRLAPAAERQDCDDVATGLLNLYLSAVSYAPLQPDSAVSDSLRRAGLRLAASLRV